MKQKVSTNTSVTNEKCNKSALQYCHEVRKIHLFEQLNGKKEHDQMLGRKKKGYCKNSVLHVVFHKGYRAKFSKVVFTVDSIKRYPNTYGYKLKNEARYSIILFHYDGRL